MTRQEMIEVLRHVDGPRVAMFDGKDWASALVDSLLTLGLVKETDTHEDGVQFILSVAHCWKTADAIREDLRLAGYRIVKA